MINFFTHTYWGIWGSGCVAQLVERFLPIPEVRASNAVIGKNLSTLNILFTVHCVLKKTKINKNRPGLAHFLRN